MSKKKGNDDSKRDATPAPGQRGGRHAELDDDTLRRAIAGEGSAQQELVRHYYRRVAAFLTLTFSSCLTEEERRVVAQKAFVKVLSAIDRFVPSPDAKVSTWLLTIAARAAIDFMRRRATRAGKMVEYEQVRQPLISTTGMPDQELWLKRLGEKIEAGVAMLDEKEKLAFVLHYREGLPYEEVAKICRAPVGTVKTWLYRARHGMQEYLKVYWNDYKGKANE